MEAAQRKTVTRSPAPEAAKAAHPVAIASAAAVRVQLQGAVRVSSPRDPAEREADATAKKIARMPSPEAAAAAGEPARVGGEGALARRPESPWIARFADAARLMREHGAAPALARKGEGRAEVARKGEGEPHVARKELHVARKGEGEPHVARKELHVARKGEGEPHVAPGVAAEIASAKGSGQPLPPAVRRFMEPRFRADFSQVRVHTGDAAARLSQKLRAQAFTSGNHIFFGRDRWRPETAEGRELLAHELTHTIQQGAAVQRSEDATVSERSSSGVQRLGISDALDYFADRANNIPGFRMFTIVLGMNPINMSRVERSAANILRAVVEFIPGGGLITRALDNYGVFDRVGAWIEQQIRSLGLTWSAIRQAITDFLDSLSWTDIFDLGGVWRRAVRIFSEPIDRIISFVGGLVTGILRFIKEAILRPLARLAEGTRGYDLLKAVLGQDPITGDPVPRNADTLIGGFMKLIGQEEIWNNLKRANAVARAWAWFQGALGALMGFIREIPGLFVQALRALEIEDIVLLPQAFAKVGRVFGGFLGRFISWAGETIWDLLEIIFSVVAPGVMVYLRRAAAAFRAILRNPIGFVGNLVRAGLLGLRQFAGRFLTHLRASLIGWLTGAMSGAGIYVPQAFTLREIIKFVLSVLGLTWQNVRQKLVRAVGEPTVRAMEAAFDVVVTLVTQGPAAAWERIQEGLSNLREMVMEQIMTFVRDRVVQAAITQLVTSLNPAGAFIQAIFAIYNTVMFFVERLRQIAQVAAAFIDSISAIAGGAIAAAANRVEQTMAGLLTLVISFLARIARLGRVSDAVTGVVNRVRQPIDRALDRVVDWIVAQARRLGRFVAQAGVPQDPNERLRLGLQAAVAAVRRLPSNRIGRVALVPLLAAIKVRYGFSSLEPEVRNGRWWVSGQVNPIGAVDLNAVPASETVASGSALYRIVRLLRRNNASSVLSRADAAALRQSLTGLAKITAPESGSTEDEEKTAVRHTRDRDQPQKQWENLHGVLRAEWVEAQALAIERLTLNVATTGDIPVLGLERGGALVAEQLATGGRRSEGIPKPPPMADENMRRGEHIELLVQRIRALVAQHPGKALDITIAETWISGSAKNSLVERLQSLVTEHQNLVLRVLALRQTLGENVKPGQQGSVREGQTNRRGKIVLTKAERVQLVWHTVPYIIGEDIDYQNVPTGESSKEPVIVFKGTGAELIAYQIIPVGDGKARDIILDLVARKISLPGVL
ncbi:eCIS core domain-containing protein [Sorangium sp. So ce131]|uniref:eCIS core domain-containing protein n=1 Tax=Sorangium sp. So ce131 TaxID=3133282 RepID=UPI003F5E3127